MMNINILSMHDLKSRYRYWPMVFSINIVDISSNIGWYFGVNIVWDTSKPSTISPVYIGNRRYL